MTRSTLLAFVLAAVAARQRMGLPASGWDRPPAGCGK
jgi:hypothetical protein